MKIVIVTDAWRPYVNGVVNALINLIKELELLGHKILVIDPQQIPNYKPWQKSYPDPRLYCQPRLRTRIGALIDEFRPDAIHISTEGMLGRAARWFCISRELPFTTFYHARHPEFLKARFGIPTALTYPVLRRFHQAASCVLTPAPTVRDELVCRKFGNVEACPHGVDVSLFRPREKNFLDLPRPIFGYAGRLWAEKNVPAFLQLPLPNGQGSKLVVGDGPQLNELRRRYPDAHFVGEKTGEDLARHYGAMDVLVFPSRNDTWGLVITEALASGVPVAAYPVANTRAIIGNSGAGCLNEDLAQAALEALNINPTVCRELVLKCFTWKQSAFRFMSCAEQFLCQW